MFTFYLANRETPVLKGSSIWHDPLPFGRNLQQNKSVSSFSYGEYFNAVRTFLESNGFEILIKALSLSLNQSILKADIKEICVHLEKHGEFYHPARIYVVLDGHVVQFVLNVAISDTGLKTIENEFEILDRFNKVFSYSYIPKTYGMGEVVSGNGSPIRLFLGEWFEGFHEFHVSGLSGKQKKIAVWDPLKGKIFLTLDQMEVLYQQAAFILTTYYNGETFEQIYPWHHAAGDFIVKLNGDGAVDLRLITVRRYGSPIEGHEKNDQDLQSIMEAMLVFFLNLSIRTRLDRLDGVDQITWSNDIAVQATVDGFFNALDLKPQIQAVSIPLTDCFKYYLSTCSMSDLLEFSQNIVEAYNPLAPEVPVIKKNLEKHIQDLHDYCYHEILSDDN